MGDQSCNMGWGHHGHHGGHHGHHGDHHGHHGGFVTNGSMTPVTNVQYIAPPTQYAPQQQQQYAQAPTQYAPQTQASSSWVVVFPSGVALRRSPNYDDRNLGQGPLANAQLQGQVVSGGDGMQYLNLSN